MKLNKFLLVFFVLVIISISSFSFVSATWTESTTYLTTPMDSQSVGNEYSFIYGLNNECLTYGDSAISHRYGYCWDGTSWSIDNSLKLPSNEYQQYQGFGGVFNLNNQEVIISAIKYHTDANYYEIRAYQNDGSMTINQSYVSGLPTSVGQYDTIINVPIDNNKNLFYMSVTGTFHAYTWDGSTWQSNTTIENNFLNAINFSIYSYVEMTPQIIDGTTYLIYNKDRVGFISAYWDGSSWVNDDNHVADLNSMIPYFNETSHAETTLSSFYDNLGNYILVNYYYNGTNHYNFYEYSGDINNPPIISTTFVNGTSYYPNDTISIQGLTSDDNLDSVSINNVNFINQGNVTNYNFQNNVDLSVGTYVLTLIVNDTEGLNDSLVVTFDVINYPNNPPKIISNFVNNTIYNSNIWINGSVIDEDVSSTIINDSRFSNSGNKVNFSFHNNTYLDNGNYSIKITTYDEGSLSDNKTFLFEVKNIIIPILTGNGTISWLNKSNFDTGNYTDTFWDINSIKLNNVLSGKYCSGIESTNATKPFYNNMTFIVNVSDMVYQKGLNISNILLHYNMDDSGVVIQDLSSYDNDGVYNGVLNSQSGVFNHSIGFDGIDDKISTPIDLGGVQHFTLGGWFYRDNSNQRMDISQSDNNNQDRIKLLANSNGLIYGVFSDGVGSFSMSPTGWFHLMMVYDGTGNTNTDRLKLYYNGIKQSLVFSGAIESIIPIIPNNLDIGYDIGSDSYTEGNFDEILILNESLNDTQVRYIYNVTKPIYYENVSVNRAVNFTIRSCNESSCIGVPFIDSDDISPAGISYLNNSKYVQWCADLSTTKKGYSPTLDDVIINFQYNATKVPIINITPLNCDFNAKAVLMYDQYPYIEKDVSTTLGWRIYEEGNPNNIITNLSDSKIYINNKWFNLIFNNQTLNHEITLTFTKEGDYYANYPYRLYFKEDLSDLCNVKKYNGVFKVRKFGNLTIKTYQTKNSTKLFKDNFGYITLESVNDLKKESELWKGLNSPFTISNFWLDKLITSSTGNKLNILNENDNVFYPKKVYYDNNHNGVTTFRIPLNEDFKVKMFGVSKSNAITFLNNGYSNMWYVPDGINYEFGLTNINLNESTTIDVLVGEQDVNPNWYFMKKILIIMGFIIVLGLPIFVYYTTRDPTITIRLFIVLLGAVSSIIGLIIWIGGMLR